MKKKSTFVCHEITEEEMLADLYNWWVMAGKPTFGLDKK
jgi:hypothetical protein